ncbi:MAG TPA: carbonic anhydrase [Candidatus Acidoferrum sp.]|nr:carbonic anhydrase [Candidatus Acidoferrum sp.]
MHSVEQDAALARLLEGNRRYYEGHARAATASAHRVELADAQRPFAIVLGCSDSRVPVETIFDQGPGDLFVIRLAGNIVSAEGLASIEYAIEILGCGLVVVLGHTGCGAVQAAISVAASGNTPPGHIGLLVEAIAPATRDAHPVEANARASARALVSRSSIVRAAVTRGGVRVAAAVYDLHTGRVRLLD